MGENWRGYQDIDPGVLTRKRILEFLAKVDPRAILDLVPHGSPKQVARIVKGYCDAGLRVPKILDYGGMAGLAYGAISAQKVRAAEDELIQLTGGN
jgi:phthiodiolone/phenolphthiodiolone dimycocerosates ketoreductase